MNENKSTERTQTNTTFGALKIGQEFRKQFKSGPMENEWLRKTSDEAACYITFPNGGERIGSHFMLATNLGVFAFVDDLPTKHSRLIGVPNNTELTRVEGETLSDGSRVWDVVGIADRVFCRDEKAALALHAAVQAAIQEYSA